MPVGTVLVSCPHGGDGVQRGGPPAWAASMTCFLTRPLMTGQVKKQVVLREGGTMVGAPRGCGAQRPAAHAGAGAAAAAAALDVRCLSQRAAAGRSAAEAPVRLRAAASGPVRSGLTERLSGSQPCSKALLRVARR